MPVPGQILGGKYRLERLVGSGGFASVWAARNVMLDRIVALKILSENYARMPGFLPRFLREAKLASRAIHRNIVGVEDIDQTQDGVVFLVMELLEGHTLADELKGGKSLPLERSVEIIAATLEGLAAAHERNIIHRDIKPANIFLTDEGTAGPRVRILDLGLAKDLVSDDELTTTDQMVGTPSYLAPEMFLGPQTRKWAPTADVFACGMLFFRMLAGGLPFDRSVANLPPIEQFLARAEFYQTVGEMPGPAQYFKSIPEDVDAVVRKAISLKLQNRFVDAAGMLAALGQTSVMAGPSDTDLRPSEAGRVSFHDLEDLTDLDTSTGEDSDEFDDGMTRVDANPWGLDQALAASAAQAAAPQRPSAGAAAEIPPAFDFETRPSTEPTAQSSGQGRAIPQTMQPSPERLSSGLPAVTTPPSVPPVGGPMSSPPPPGAPATQSGGYPSGESPQAPGFSFDIESPQAQGSSPEGASVQPSPRKPRRFGVLLVLLVIVVVVLGLAVALGVGAAWQRGVFSPAGQGQGRAPRGQPPSVQQTPQPPPPTGAAPPPSGVVMSNLEIQSEPPGATVLLDDAVVGTTPFQVSVPRSGQSKRLVVRADGYRPVEQTLRFDQSHRLQFNLEPLGR